jgi:hypothetical protein
MYIKPLRHTYYSIDITESTKDKLRIAMGCYFTKKEGTPAASTLSAPHTYEMEHPFGAPTTAVETSDTHQEFMVTISDHLEPFNKLKLFEGWEVNPYRTKKINDSAYVPNFKVPLRIVVDRENTQGDKYWNTYFMGGMWGDNAYIPLVDETIVYYSTIFTVCLPYSQQFMNITGFEMNWNAEMKSGLYSVVAQINEYDENVANRIIYETTISEKLLPNYAITLDFLQLGDFTSSGASYESGMSVGDEVLTPQRMSTYKWFMQDDVLTTINAARTPTDYYNTNWPKLWNLDGVTSENRQTAEISMENLLFDQYYFEYYYGKGSTPKSHWPGPGTNKRHLLQSSAPYNITFSIPTIQDQTQMFAIEAAEYYHPLDLEAWINFVPQQWDQPYNYNFIRNMVEDQDLSSKLLETLKDIDEGSLPNFPQTIVEYGVEQQYSYDSDGAGLVWCHVGRRIHLGRSSH